MKNKKGMMDILSHIIFNYTEYANSKVVKLFRVIAKNRITKYYIDFCDTVFLFETKQFIFKD